MPPQRRTSAGRSPFGELLVSLRTARGLTQEGLAALSSTVPVSARSITNYERNVADARMWTLPHRPAMWALAEALKLDSTQKDAMAKAFSQTKALKDAATARLNQGEFIPDGREHHIRHLLSRWQRALSGTPQIVLLTGESGVGKSTLARHLCETVAASHPGVMISWGEAASRGATIEPYLALRHATDRMLVPPPPTMLYPGASGSRPQLSDSRARQILPFLPKLNGVLVSERTIADLGAAHVGISQEEIDSILMTRSSTESLGRWDEYGRLLMALSQEWPLLIVLENLHWTANLTAQLLTHLHDQMQHMRNVPLLIVGTVFPGGNDDPAVTNRSGLEVLRHTLAHSDNGAAISLMDTTFRKNGSAFVRGMLDRREMISQDNEDLLVSWLVERTSGHPMLTIEMIRHLEAVGALARPKATSPWTFTEAVIPPDLPVAITSIMSLRLGQLSRRARAILDAAAVMGGTILPESLAPVVSMETEALLELIDEVLVDQHYFLQPVTEEVTERDGRLRYRFTHSIYREYIYASLPQFRRRALHRAIADQLVKDFPDTDLTAMSETTNHYVHAEDWAAAEKTAFRMAQLAVIRLDWDLSRFWFERSEDLAVKARDAQQLWTVRAARLAMMRSVGEHKEAIVLAEQILSQVAFQNWGKTEALTRHLLGEIYYDLGELRESIEQLTLALALHMQEQTMDLASAAEAMLSHATYRQGRYDIARTHARNALELSRSLDDSWVQSEALLAAANCEVDLGNYEAAIQTYQTAADLALVVGKLSNQFIPAINTGLCLTLMGRNAEGMAKLEEVMADIERHNAHRLIGPGAQYLGFAYEQDGQWDRARAEFQRSADIRRNRAPSPTLYDCLAGLVRVAVATNDHAALQKHLTELEDFLIADDLDGMEDPVEAMLSVANAHRHLGDEDRYGHWIREAHAFLMQRASQIEDEQAVRSFLTNVPSNRQTMAAWNSLPLTPHPLDQNSPGGAADETAARG